MKKLYLSLAALAPLAALSLVAMPVTANAAACRDANGRFAACGTSTSAKAKPKPAAAVAAKPKAPATHVAKAAPAKPAAAKPAMAKPTLAKATTKVPAKRCKVAGKFASCSAPGAKPA